MKPIEETHPSLRYCYIDNRGDKYNEMISVSAVQERTIDKAVLKEKLESMYIVSKKDQYKGYRIYNDESEIGFDNAINDIIKELELEEKDE